MNYKLFLSVLFISVYTLSPAQNRSDIKINGRVQYDYIFTKRKAGTTWQIGNEFRRIHLSVTGKWHQNFKYKIEFDFSGGSPSFRDIFIEYNAGKWGSFALGNKPEPTSLSMLTSSQFFPLIERAMLTSLQNFRWGTGFHYHNYQVFNNKGGVQLALTNKGTTSNAFKDMQVEQGVNLLSRIFITPLINPENNQLLHLGFNYASRPYTDLKFKPENHMAEKYHYIFDGGKRNMETGFESAWNYQNFSLQGEYKTRTVSNDLNRNYTVTSYYALASIFITGEHRPYKHGAFGRVKPRKDINHGGLGAWELVFRYSVMDFSNDILSAPVNNGLPRQVKNYGFGINWYLTSHIRFMYNFILTNDGNNSGNLNSHLFRFHINF